MAMPETPLPAVQDQPVPTSPQQGSTVQNVVAEGAPTAATTGRRASFRDLRRQLTEEDLRQPGVQKLLIEDFEKAEMECEALRCYLEKFHESDKQVAILNEKLKLDNALEIVTGVGLAGGSAIMGVAPSFWGVSTLQGEVALLIGALFVFGAIAAKVVHRSK
jgi:hypothetical protein